MERAFDVVSIVLIYNNLRLVLDQKPYTMLTAFVRPLTSYTSYPVAWAKYNETTAIFGPAPNQAYSTIWDVCVYSAALVNTTDTDAMPYPYTECIPYWAAHLACLAQRQFAEADYFGAKFEEEYDAAVNARTGITPSYYRGRV